jgi:transcription-repair coupling factor (superfamily II helicase)
MLSQSLQQQKLEKAIAISKNKVHIKGLIGSSLSFAVANAFTNSGQPFLVILNDKEEAAYHLNDLEQLLGEQKVLVYP